MLSCLCNPAEPDFDESYTNYLIRIKTSDAYVHAGTNSRIELQIIGDLADGETERVDLNGCFQSGFNRGSLFHVNKQLRYVGTPIMLKIKLKGCLFTDEWLCDWIEITVHHEKVLFPIYSFIEGEVKVCAGTASLPQKETNFYLKNQRRIEIKANQAAYQWIKDENNKYKGFPKYGDFGESHEIPKIFQRQILRARDFYEHGLDGIIDKTIEIIKNFARPIDDFDSYRDLSRAISPPFDDFHENWKEDLVQGWQILNGVYPTAYKLCKKIPNHFKVTNEALKDIIGEETVDSLIEKEQLYISDFSEVFSSPNIQRVKGSTGENAVCLPATALFLNDSKGFRPIAIQLKPNDPKFLSVADNSNYWLLAKMYYRCCVSNYHEWIMHFLYTHNVMEPFCISLFRCLPRCHPVYKLLRPHLRTVVAINQGARDDLLPPTSRVAFGLATDAGSVVRHVYKSFHLDDLNIPKVLKKQGIDPAKFENNWYATDALALWNIIERYVTSILKIYYKNEEDVKNDFELQGWNTDFTRNGFECTRENYKGFPASDINLEQLIEICTIIIFTGSAQHAAVNFGQFQTYRFAPSSPVIMNLEPPENSSEIDLDLIMKTLPTKAQALASITFSSVLSKFSEADVYLGDWKENWFTEYEPLKVQSEFKHECEVLHHEIKMRNRKLDRPYKYLDPVQVPNNIAI